MTITPDSLRSDLEDLERQDASAQRADERIRTEAARRRDEITARMDELRHTAISDPGAADEYQSLVAERGRLDLVLAK